MNDFNPVCAYILILSRRRKRRMNDDFLNFAFDHWIRPGRRSHTYLLADFGANVSKLFLLDATLWSVLIKDHARI